MTKKITAVLLALFLMMSMTSFGLASGEEWTYRSESISCAMLDRLATRSGPGTQYAEPGTFFRNNAWKGKTVLVLKKAQGDGIWWVQVDFRTNDGNRYRVWTGRKRVEVNLDLVREEIPVGDCDISQTGNTRWGPGENYAAANVSIPTSAIGMLYETENGWCDIEYFCDNGDYGRVWIPAECVHNVDTTTDRSGEN